MSRARVAVPELAEGPRAMGPDASRHLAVVLRLGAGDEFVAFDPTRGVEATGRVISVRRGAVDAELGPVRPAERVARTPITFIQGLPKGDKPDAIVRDATELGATRIVFAETAFAVVRLDGPRALARVARWTRIAAEAARQCGRADPPAVGPPLPWLDALASAGEAGARFCLHEKARAPLGPSLARAIAEGFPLAFAAGPEGGLSADEVEAARGAGFQIVQLGGFVLRAETVAAAVLGAARVLSAPANTDLGAC